MLPGIAPIADRYDGFILDLWGVIHDGERPYPAVPECLDRLRAAGKRTLLLSNAPRRVAGTVDKLAAMGIGPDRYDAVLTSGEATHQALKAPPDAWHAALGRRCLHLGPPRDADVWQDVPGLETVDDPADATFVLNTGVHDYADRVADYEDVLSACARHRLPMVCANSDLVVVVGQRMAICAGTLAGRYEEMGGEVRYHGKPWPEIYVRCFELLGVRNRARILAVGDSLRTDVAGAATAGIDSALVTGGIHREELSIAWGEHPDPEKLAAVLEALEHHPTWVIPHLVW